MPQQDQPQAFVFRDSLHLDTIWLDIDALPAKRFNPIDTPELVLFNIDSAIAHQVEWGQVDTFKLHRMERPDTVFKESFLNIYHTPGKTGTPETAQKPTTQLIMSALVLLILFGSLAIIFTSSKNRLLRYFLSLFDKRKFKDYFAEENPGFMPTVPVVYLLQSMVVGCVAAVWLMAKLGVDSSIQFIGTSILVMAGFAVVPLFRNTLILVLGNIFMIQQETRKHIFISYLTHSFLFLLLLPLALQQAIHIPQLEPYFNTAFFTCFGLAMGYQLVKLIQNTPFRDMSALLYIFLYFCTLEILPLFLIYKVVSIYAYT